MSRFGNYVLNNSSTQLWLLQRTLTLLKYWYSGSLWIVPHGNFGQISKGVSDVPCCFRILMVNSIEFTYLLTSRKESVESIKVRRLGVFTDRTVSTTFRLL
jgi:hypothetical protein